MTAGLAVQPGGAAAGLALGAVPVAAGVVQVLALAATAALLQPPSQQRRAAGRQIKDDAALRRVVAFDDMLFNLCQLELLQSMPEYKLNELTAHIRRQIVEQYTWTQFNETVWAEVSK